MSGSTTGKIFKVATFGESHGKAIGAVIDGCPAGLTLSEEYIQQDLNRRKPGASPFATKRKEQDVCRILSGVFNGVTTGTPICVIIDNEDQNSKDYSSIMEFYRPGHADFTYDAKYGFRDFRGGGRSSGRETAARVAAGSVARKILEELGVFIAAFTLSIGNIKVPEERINIPERFNNPLVMPDNEIYLQASAYLQKLMEEKNSAGGICRCVVKGIMPGVGEPVFDKLEAEISKAIMSIGAVKGIEFGSGFRAAEATGSENNDIFFMSGKYVKKETNNSGGVLGGISDGADLVFNVAIKPTPSIGAEQRSVDKNGNEVVQAIAGRHDPVIVPRAIVVVEAMTAICLCDLLLQNLSSRMEYIKKIYKTKI